jgi:CelD/BcsL family acetyltransferase involved in cellulose biosynthesis
VRALLELTGSSRKAGWEVGCPFVTLPGDWETFEGSLDGKFRRDLNRRIRKLEDEAGEPVSLTTATDEGELSDALSDLFRLHEEDGSGGAFDTGAKREFYRELARRFARRGWLRLHLLRVGERAIAAALCYHFGGKAWFYQTGFDREWYRYSPGHVVIRHAIRRAIEEGAEEFDMLRGDHGYKYDWNAESRAILKMRIATTAVGGVVVPAAGWLREAKERWKAWRGTP